MVTVTYICGKKTLETFKIINDDLITTGVLELIKKQLSVCGIVKYFVECERDSDVTNIVKSNERGKPYDRTSKTSQARVL